MNRVLYIRCCLFSIAFLCSVIASVAAEGDTQYLPLAKYDYLSVKDQQINSAGGGLVIVSDRLFFAGIYTYHSFAEQPELSYPEKYQGIELLVDGKINRHGYLAVFKSISDQPVYGGLPTYQGAVAYSYELIAGEHLTLALGAGLAVSDFGIELSNGKPWPILPVPLVRLGYTSTLIDLKLELITGPNLSFVMAPDSRIRFLGDFRMDQFRDIRDLIFECALEYRLFPADHVMGELAGISAGAKSDRLSFVPASKDEDLDIHYYSLFGRLDLSLLSITAGYAFDTVQILSENKSSKLGTGFFISIQAALPL